MKFTGFHFEALISSSTRSLTSSLDDSSGEETSLSASLTLFCDEIIERLEEGGLAHDDAVDSSLERLYHPNVSTESSNSPGHIPVTETCRLQYNILQQASY